MLQLQLQSIENTEGRYYYVGQEVSLTHYRKTSFDVTDIHVIDRTVYVFVWHNGRATLYDRFSMDTVKFLEGVTLSDEEAEAFTAYQTSQTMDGENAGMVLGSSVYVEV